MRFVQFLFKMALGFFVVFGVGVAALGLIITGGPSGADVSLVRDGAGKAYVKSLKGVEQTAKRLRGAYCAGEQQPGKGADCG